MARKTLVELINESDHCIVTPCIYDCASARAVELVGFEAIMVSSGELSIAMNGVVDYGFTNLTDLEWMVSRLSETSPLAMCADIEDGFGGPLAVYRAAKRLARAGAHALQLEDSTDMEDTTSLLPREQWYEKVRAALAGLEGTDCILIARTNADPDTQLEEGTTRLAHAVELGAQMTTLVKTHSLEQARFVAERVPGWKMYPDVSTHTPDGQPEVTVDQIYPLGYRIMTMHYTLKAAMDGMLEHGLRNFAQQGNHYTCVKPDATGIYGASATPLWDAQAYMALEARFSGRRKEYQIVGNHVEGFPSQFVTHPVEDRI